MRGWAALALGLALMTALSLASLAIAQTGGATVNVPVGQLCQATAAHGPGTTYLLGPATAEAPHDARCTVEGVAAQTGDTFAAAQPGAVPRPRVSGFSEARRVFNIRAADNVAFRDLHISGATGDDSCEPGCGSGIAGNGANPSVSRTTFTGLPNQGIGWSGTSGCLTVDRVLMVGVGSIGFSGMDPDVTPQGRSTAGIKATGPCLSVTDSVFRDTFWSPIWCDEDCARLTATGNTIDGYGKGGVHVEVSRGPGVVAYNTIRSGGVHGSSAPGKVGGVLVRRSVNQDVHHNDISRVLASGQPTERAAIYLVPDGQATGTDPPPLGFSGVRVRANTTHGFPIVGCTEAGVTCRNNR